MRTIKWMVARRMGVVATPCGVASCSRVPNLTPHVSYVPIREEIKQATLIVVGIVEREHVVRTVDSGPKEDSGRLELRAVRIRVEGVLEGKVTGERLPFFYYQVTGGWDGPEPNMDTPGERGIFYLVKDEEVWRGATDAYASQTRLVTGRHRIVRLSLLPEEGADLNGFVGSLHGNSAMAMGLLGNAEVSQILHTLLANSNPEIRGRACITMAEFPLKERGCLPEVLNDVQARPEDRKRAEALMRQN